MRFWKTTQFKSLVKFAELALLKIEMGSKSLQGIHFVLQDAEPRKDTAFLVVGSKAGKRKIDKALAYGRPVLTEAEAISVMALLKK